MQHHLETENLASRFRRADPVPPPIRVKLSDDAIQNVTFIKADAMTFSDDPFDVVVSLETIEHLPDPNKFTAQRGPEGGIVSRSEIRNP
jgi:2-polyprenyl-3-methyl-5-hydroxy-6-metoxy-1,4-benzoquinol methylase